MAAPAKGKEIMLSIYNSKDHRWRDAYNPLRGLNMPKLVSLLDAGDPPSCKATADMAGGGPQ